MRAGLASFLAAMSCSGESIALNVLLPMQARSYKGEIIQACIAGGNTWRMGLNFIFNLRDLGYDHWVIFVPREQQCHELEAALPGGVGSIGELSQQLAGRRHSLSLGVLVVNVSTKCLQAVFCRLHVHNHV